VLELIFGRRRDAALEYQSSRDQAIERHARFGLAALRGGQQQLVGKIAADRRPDLRHFSSRRTEPVEPRHQRGP